uniref:Reverse transcriptase domain-containing protein n=1 Tax=Lactuca sativa TaxID=4236 RepID=A0A9R1VNZ4_LACSA|nr:hypothetical protein LSAT_V11C400225360 [Lactuca sativa]
MATNMLEPPFSIEEIKSTVWVDFDKAFDSVNWEYLDSLQNQTGYGEKWCKWVKGCLVSSRASVLVNGYPTVEFSMEKGVRQGDPLIPLSIHYRHGRPKHCYERCVEKGIFKGITILHGEARISHLFFADDVLLVGEWSRSNIKNLARIVRRFHVTFGLKVFGIGASIQEVARWATPLRCEPTTFPFTYLGFHVKLSTWKAKTLSFGDRMTLIKSVLGNLPTFYLSLFTAPIGGGHKEKKKVHLVSWEKVKPPKEMGGLGIGLLRALNLALMMKWWWRKAIPGVWRNVAGIKNDLKELGIYMDVVVKHMGTQPLKLVFSALYQLERYKTCRVADRIQVGRHTWRWKSARSSADQVNELQSLSSRCGISSDGMYHADVLRQLIDKPTTMVSTKNIDWIREMPIKDRILTLRELMKMGLIKVSFSYTYCSSEEEDVSHVLIKCPFATIVWEWCWIRCLSP